jgi:hypothetical protein
MKYLLDIICVVIVVILALLTTQRPVIDLIGRTGVSPVIPSEKTAIKEETKKVQKEIVRDVFVSKVLKDRNIFSADRKYAIVTSGGSSSGTGGPLPENPYTLIGILQGEEKKAVFREYTGSIVFLTVGKKLIDDSVITRIDRNSVEVRKGKEKKELKIFDVKVPRLSTGRKP